MPGAVVGDQGDMDTALGEMVDKIETLATAVGEGGKETVAGLVRKKRVKEQELRKTLKVKLIVITLIFFYVFNIIILISFTLSGFGRRGFSDLSGGEGWRIRQ